MIYNNFDDIQCIVIDGDDTTKYLSFTEVKNLPTPKDFYNILLFFFPNDDEYYNKPYIKECVFSWKKVFPKSRFINIPVYEALGMSKWSMLTYRRRNFPTDSLRVLFSAHLDNCLYLDTDVYLTQRFNMPKKDCFVLNDCSGTMLFNKKKNNKKFLKWFEKYEEVADYIVKNSEDRTTQDLLIDKYGDLAMYHKFGKDLKIPSLDIRHGVNHFSAIYPYMRDKINLGLAVDPKNGSVASFEIESIYAFSLYCYDRGYTEHISPCFYGEDKSMCIGFYTH